MTSPPRLALRDDPLPATRSGGQSASSRLLAVPVEVLPPDGMSLYDTCPARLHALDERGRIIAASDAWLHALGYERDEVIGRHLAELVAPGHDGRSPLSVTRLLGTEPGSASLRLCRRDGTIFEAVMTIAPVTARPGVAPSWSALLSAPDATELLAGELERMRTTLRSIGDAVITADASGLIDSMNRAAERLTGWREADALWRPLPEVFRAGLSFDAEPVLTARDGTERAIESTTAPICDATGAARGTVLVFRDVSEQRRRARELSHRARHDPLTGQLNRSEFDQRLVSVIDRIALDHSRHALLVIDLDEFKQVNDRAGHAAGDAILRAVAGMIEGSVRRHDTIARLGGDEFGVILEHCGIEQAVRVGETIRDRVGGYRLTLDSETLSVGTSIGAVELDASWPDAAAALRAADLACLAAKRQGRNRVLRHEPEAGASVQTEDTGWGRRLERALIEDHFVLFCQRIEALHDKESRIHCEVLLRLREPGTALISPGVFLRAAERARMAQRVDRWVIRHVARWMREAGPALATIDTIGINLSAQSIADPDFLRYVLACLSEDKTGIEKLCFEVPERVAYGSLGSTTRFSETVHRLGCRFALDDYGLGASSFGALKALPIDYLKIDGSVVRDLSSDAVDRAAVRCIQEVAHLVGQQTVAEGVEDESVRQVLADMGIDFAQGYLHHRPMPLDALLDKPDAPLA